MLEFHNVDPSSLSWIKINNWSMFDGNELTNILSNDVKWLVHSDAKFLEYISKFIHLLL